MSFELLREIGLTLLGALAMLWVAGMVGAVLVVLTRAVWSDLRSGVHAGVVQPRPAAPVLGGPPRAVFNHVLFVRVDERRARLVPEIDVLIRAGLPRARLTLELVDVTGAVRRRMSRILPEDATSTRVRFASFGPPGDATVADVLTWRWDVALFDAEGQRACWQQRLTPAGRIDDEAELGALDLSAEEIVCLVRTARRRAAS